MTVSLHARGAFTWHEWTDALARELAAATARDQRRQPLLRALACGAGEAAGRNSGRGSRRRETSSKTTGVWRTRQDVSVGLLTEADIGDRLLEAYYGDIGFREEKAMR